MKKIYFSILLLVFMACSPCKAQYVTIPDPAFVTWLQNNGYASCMSGSQLDTTCNAVLTATVINCTSVPIYNLSGIQYFKSLTTLNCNADSLNVTPILPSSLVSLNFAHNELNVMPTLPSGLHTLTCDFNAISTVNSLPSGLQQFSCAQNYISNLPALPSTLQTLACDYNFLTSLPPLPSSLQNLSCVYNVLHTLPALPGGLKTLSCFGDSLSTLPTLPATLITLNCNVNALTTLPALPSGLTSLQCGTNALTALPVLPPALQTLFCLQNQISVFPALPSSLTLINCNSNLFTSIPVLPAGLQTLSCAFNQLTALPALPAHLQVLNCSFNHISNLLALPLTIQTLSCNANHLTTLPDLPPSLTDVNCSFNQLTDIPPLPDSLHSFDASYNAGLSCLPQLKRIVTLNFSNCAINCIPDYGRVTTSTPALDTVPLCGIFNRDGCQVFGNLSGQAYYDQNSDCKFDSIDAPMGNVKAQLYSSGVLQQQVFTGAYGVYSFDSVGYGNYAVAIDTSELPFMISCPGSGYYNVSLSATDSVSYSNNFAFKCPETGFDVGVQSILNTYASPTAGSTFALNVKAGDISALYGAQCAAGISGQVQIIYSGPVNFVAPATGALTPTLVNGDTLMWTIADFGTINSFSAFNLLMKVDSPATPGASICFTVLVTPTAGDNNPSNNNLTYCFTVDSTARGTEKEVYPSGNIDTTNHWLTYTIRFQNTGSTVARNLRITDTLDSHLDPSTFQLLSYSAKNVTQIFGSDVVFNFPDINLPDSLTNDSASRGYIQYKIKLKDNLPVGTEIYNTANIYFSVNSPSVTNITINTIVPDTTVGIRNLNSEPLPVNLYPNPAREYTTVSVSDNLLGSWLELSDAVGRNILRMQINTSRLRLQTGGLAKGVYFIRIVKSNKSETVKKLVVN
jgi:uncharacterized repeat protein (TIGR01451 family)